MDKKANLFGIVVIIIIILMITGTVAFILYKEKVKEIEKQKKIENATRIEHVPFLVIAKDVKTGEQLSIHFSIESEGKVFGEGTTNSLVPEERKVEMNKTYDLYCWETSQYYISKTKIQTYENYKEICGDEYDNNHNSIIDEQPCLSPMQTCLVHKTGLVNISLNGKLEPSMNVNMSIDITSENKLQGISLCIRWTAGFLYATFDNFRKECYGVDCIRKQQGKKINITCFNGWQNWSSWNDINKTFVDMPFQEYRCTNPEVNATCKRVSGSTCILPKVKIPSRQYKMLDCFETDYNVDANIAQVPIMLKTSNMLNFWDYFEVCVIDKDYFKDSNNKWYYGSTDLYEKDVGANDSCQKIYYEMPNQKI